MRDSILRVIDDLQTRYDVAKAQERETESSREPRDVMSNMWASGATSGLQYAMQELKKVLDDHANPENKRVTSDTQQTQ